ncbi:MAG: hypothetical protein WAQ98_32395 [Blastocatellia bacterium]
MIRQFFRMGLVWLIVITFVVFVASDFFSRPKRVATTTVKESDNPFSSKKGNSNNKDETVGISEPPAPVDPEAIILTGKIDHTFVEIKKCTGSGSEVTVEGTLINQGTDGFLKFYVRNYEESTKLYDDFGNRVLASSIQIANLEDNSSVTPKLISGVQTNFVIRFKGMPTVGGQTQAKKIKVLEFWAEGFKAEFRNIEIQQVNKRETIATTPAPNATPVIASPNPTTTPTNIENK